MTSSELLSILSDVSRLKTTYRHCFMDNGRKESVADHCWRTAVFAMLLSGEEEFKDTDMNKVIKMCLIHDLGESFTGDIPVFEKTGENTDEEKNALTSWVASFPEPLKSEWSSLIGEMSLLETKEAKLFKAIDKLEAVISHNEYGTETWLPLEYDLQLTHGTENVKFSPYMSGLKKEIDKRTEELIRESRE